MKEHDTFRTHGMTRRAFLRNYGIAAGALTFSPYFIDRFAAVCRADATTRTRVYLVKNGDCFQNTAKLWELAGGVSRYIEPSDVVVIKANAQWPNQGYTHTGCIKGIIDRILALPGFSGEVLICDNIQWLSATGATGFDATVSNRVHNWADHNWDSLAAQYQAAGKPVATKRWVNGPWRTVAIPGFSSWNPADGEGWTRMFFDFNGRSSYLSYPVFASPLTPGRLIDLKNGVWEQGMYTGRKVKVLCMPTLNNHGSYQEDYAGVTSAIKSFYGATEIHVSPSSTFNGHYHIHSTSYTQNNPLSAQWAGELVGQFLNTFYAPALFVTAAMWSGHISRTGGATETKTVLACENPVSLDYVACRDVISPYASFLNPDQDNNTRRTILGCNSMGIGTADPAQLDIITYDFLNPTTSRLDVERSIRDFKSGAATQQDVKDTINRYMEGE